MKEIFVTALATDAYDPPPLHHRYSLMLRNSEICLLNAMRSGSILESQFWQRKSTGYMMDEIKEAFQEGLTGLKELYPDPL